MEFHLRYDGFMTHLFSTSFNEQQVSFISFFAPLKSTGIFCFEILLLI